MIFRFNGGFAASHESSVMRHGVSLLMLFLAALLTSCSPKIWVAQGHPAIPVQALNRKASEITKTIRGTASPNGRWAVGVGMPDGSIPQWEVVDHQDERGRSFIINRDYDIANYLVDLKNDRIVAVLDSCHWGTVDRYNHQDFEIRWSPDSRWLVVAHHWKWHTGSCSVYQLDRRGVAMHGDLLPMASTVLKRSFVDYQPAITDWDYGDYVLRAAVMSVDDQGLIRCRVTGEVPKREAPLLEAQAAMQAINGRVWLTP